MKIFVAHPYSFKECGYREILSKALENTNFELVYADDKVLNMHVLTKIKRMMTDAEFSLFDVTGANFNVGLELGLAIGGGNLGVMAIQQDEVPVLPADVIGWDQLRYSDFVDLGRKIRDICETGAYELTSSVHSEQTALVDPALPIEVLDSAEITMPTISTYHPSLIDQASMANAEGRVYTLVGASYPASKRRDIFKSEERKLLTRATKRALTQEQNGVRHSATLVTIESAGEPFMRIAFDISGVMIVLFGWRKYPSPDASWKDDPFPIEAAVLGLGLGIHLASDEDVLKVFGPERHPQLTLGLLNWPPGGISAEGLIQQGSRPSPAATTHGYRYTRTYRLETNDAWHMISDFLQYVLTNAGLIDFEESLTKPLDKRVIEEVMLRNGLVAP